MSRNNWQWKHNNSKPMGCSKSSSKREVYNNTILPQETRKISNKQPNFTPKATGEKRRKTTTIRKNKQKIKLADGKTW